MLNLCIPYRSEFMFFFPKDNAYVYWCSFWCISMCVRVSFLCNYSAKLKTPFPWSLCIRKRVSFDYKVNAAASDRGVTCWYAFYQDDLCKLCTLFPQESLFWKCQDKLPEISHKIHCAGSVRWRPPWSQGHWAAVVTLGLACLPHAWHSWLLKTSAQTDTLKSWVALSTSGRSAKQVLH